MIYIPMSTIWWQLSVSLGQLSEPFETQFTTFSTTQPYTPKSAGARHFVLPVGRDTCCCVIRPYTYENDTGVEQGVQFNCTRQPIISDRWLVSFTIRAARRITLVNRATGRQRIYYVSCWPYVMIRQHTHRGVKHAVFDCSVVFPHPLNCRNL